MIGTALSRVIKLRKNHRETLDFAFERAARALKPKLNALKPALWRRDFVPTLARRGKALEIGPAQSPTLKGANIFYFDVYDSEGLHARSARINETTANIPEIIHYVSPEADMGIVPGGEFDLVFSSHVIEHQTDIVRHVQEIARILAPGGAYALIVPDCRFCYDAHIPPATIGDVIEAHETGRRRHRLRAFVDSRVMSSHNNAHRHWIGDTPPLQAYDAHEVQEAIEEWRQAEQAGAYTDVHGFQFTPQSFYMIFDCLHRMGLSPLKVSAVHDTPRDAIEFCVVLERA